MGTGFYFSKEGKTFFKFVKCVNRPGCSDFEVNHTSNSSYNSIGDLTTIYTRFESFEEAQSYDIKENLARNEKRKLEKPGGYCQCPIPISVSILNYANDWDY